jgi:hypothetical protein
MADELFSVITSAAFNTAEGVGEQYEASILVETAARDIFRVKVDTFWSTLNINDIEQQLHGAAQPESTPINGPFWDWVVTRVMPPGPLRADEL